MENKFRFVKERVKSVALVGNSWRLVSMVRERYVRRSEIKRRDQLERDRWQSVQRQLSARLLRFG